MEINESKQKIIVLGPSGNNRNKQFYKIIAQLVRFKRNSIEDCEIPGAGTA